MGEVRQDSLKDQIEAGRYLASPGPREEGFRHGGHPVKGGGWWFGAAVDSPPARQGVNYVLVRPGPGCMGKATSRIEDARIWVQS